MIDTILRYKSYDDNAQHIAELRFPYQLYLNKDELRDGSVVRVAIGTLDTKERLKHYDRLYRLSSPSFFLCRDVLFYSGEMGLLMHDCAIIPTKKPYGYFLEFESEYRNCRQMSIKEAQATLI